MAKLLLCAATSMAASRGSRIGKPSQGAILMTLDRHLCILMRSSEASNQSVAAECNKEARGRAQVQRDIPWGVNTLMLFGARRGTGMAYW
jgi:hypothetical protein